MQSEHKLMQPQWLGIAVPFTCGYITALLKIYHDHDMFGMLELVLLIPIYC